MDGGITGTIIGGVMGFAAAIIPLFINGFRDQNYTSGTNNYVTDGETPLYPDEGGPSVQADAPIVYRFLDFFRAGVRPALTYAFFALFCYIKIAMMYQGMYVDQTKVIELLPAIWNDGTEALFAAVIAFWFGSRALSKLRS